MKVQHWPATNSIGYLVYKCLNDQAPLYLQKLLQHQELEKETRSSGKRLFKITKRKCKTFLDRSFKISDPKLWNTLPASIKNATAPKDFNKMLKTHALTLGQALYKSINNSRYIYFEYEGI